MNTCIIFHLRNLCSVESGAWKHDYLRYVALAFLNKEMLMNVYIPPIRAQHKFWKLTILLLYFKGSLVTAKHNCPHLAHTKMKAWRKYERYATEPAGDNKCNANRSNWKENPHSAWNPSIIMGLLHICQDCSSTWALKFIRHHVYVRVGLTKWKKRSFMHITQVCFYTQQVFITLSVCVCVFFNFMENTWKNNLLFWKKYIKSNKTSLSKRSNGNIFGSFLTFWYNFVDRQI